MITQLQESASRTVAPFHELFPWERRFLEAPGGALHYVDEGPRDAPVLLCLHGNPTWSFFWRKVIARFHETHRVIALDHLGCGLSARPDRPVRLQEHTDNVLHLARALDLTDITLVVHDWGGAIGMGAAAREPARFARFVISNTAAFPSRRIPLRIAVGRVPVLGRIAIQGFNAFARAATVMAVERPLEGSVKRGLLAPYRTRATRRATWDFVQDIPLAPAHPSWESLKFTADGLTALTDRPMLLVWGERDWCFTPAFRDEWQQRFPAARSVRLGGAGHYLIEDEPDGYLEAVSAFLDSTHAARAEADA